MQAIIIHGMGRTPLSMYYMAYRLNAAGIKPRLFGYCVTVESWARCTARLKQFIDSNCQDRPYIVVTHSLGSVFTRAVLPSLSHQPTACFFLAPPTQACHAARRLSQRWWYRLLAGEIGQLLADQAFMSALPIPQMLTKIYAGNVGLTGSLSPFGEEQNDGILTVNETTLTGAKQLIVPSLHTFIMNNRAIIDNIINETARLTAS